MTTVAANPAAAAFAYPIHACQPRPSIQRRIMASDFFRQVYRAVSMIPRGQVATYGQIAAYVGNPRGARTVGWALHGLPAGSGVPWHRVINAQGSISTSREGSRPGQQRAMLEDEGIVFDEKGRMDLKTLQWKGPL